MIKTHYKLSSLRVLSLLLCLLCFASGMARAQTNRFYKASTYLAGASNTSAGAAGTAINNWTDKQGGVWSVVSNQFKATADSVDISQYARDIWMRPASEDRADQKIALYLPANASASASADILLRYNRNTNSGILCVADIAPTTGPVLTIFTMNNGSPNQGNTTGITGFNPAHPHVFTASVIGSSVQLTFYDTVDQTTTSCGGSTTISGSGSYALSVHSNPAATSGVTLLISDVELYNSDPPPAALSASAPSVSGITQSGYTATETASGGTPPYIYRFDQAPDNGGSAGTFTTVASASSNNVYTASGLSPPGTTYWVRCIVTDSAGTPASVTTSAVSLTTTASPAYTLSLPQSAIYFSPSGTDLSVIGHAIWVSPGNYLKTVITNTQAAACSLVVNTANVGSTADAEKPFLEWSIDNGAIQSAQLTTANTSGGFFQLTSSLAAGTHNLTVWNRSTSPFIPRYAVPTTGAVDITGFSVSSGTFTLASPTLLSSRALFAGDSMTEGEGTDGFVTNGNHAGYAGSSDFLHGWAAQVADSLGAEYSVSGIGGQGWTSTAADGQTPGFTIAFPYVRSGKARILTGLDYLIVNQGTNGNTIGATGAVAGFLTNARSLVGSSCKIVLLVPSSGAARSGLISDFTSYQGGAVTTQVVDGITIYKGTADAKTVLIDLGPSAAVGLALPAVTNSAGSLTSYDTTHNNTYGNSRIASMVAKAITYAFSGGTTTTVSGTKRKVQ